MIDFEATEYTVTEGDGSVTLCLMTSTGNVEPVTIMFMSRHVSTSGKVNTSIAFKNVTVCSTLQKVIIHHTRI